MAELEGEKLIIVLARCVPLVTRRSKAKYIYCSLLDTHVLSLVESTHEHIAETPNRLQRRRKEPLATRIIIRIIRTGTVPIAGIRQYAMRVTSTICMTAISITCTMIMLMSTSSRSVRPIPSSALKKRAVHISMAHRVGMKLYRTAIISITS